MTPLEVTFPLRTLTGMNSRLCWQAKARSVRGERQMTSAALTAAWQEQEAGHRINSCDRMCRFTVMLTRISPRKCDDDNLQGALKHVRDATALWLGIDDGSPRFDWRYSQERGPWGVRIRIEEVQPATGKETHSENIERLSR